MHFTILKMVATSGFLTVQGCTPDRAGGAYSGSPDVRVSLRHPTSNMRGRKGVGKGRGKGRGVKGMERRKIERALSVNSCVHPCNPTLHHEHLQ